VIGVVYAQVGRYAVILKKKDGGEKKDRSMQERDVEPQRSGGTFQTKEAQLERKRIKLKKRWTVQKEMGSTHLETICERALTAW